jgi:PAS domain S-box-containing protein
MKVDMNSVKRLMKNFVTSGMYDDYDVEIMRKVIMINIVSIIGVANLIPLGILAFVEGNFPLGFFDFVVAAVLIVNLLYLRTSRRYTLVSYVGISFAAVLFVYLFVTGGQNNTGHLWYYTFPLFTSFLLGSKRGAIGSLIILSPAILLFAVNDISPHVAVYETDFKMRFIPSFLVVLGYSYAFENMREKTQYKLGLRNAELQESISELKRTEGELQKIRADLERRVKERTVDLTKANEELSQEVDERRRAEEALRKSEEQYKVLVDSSLTGIFIHQDQKYVFVTNKFAEMHGYKPEELLGKDPLSLIHPDDREISREVASRRLRGEDVTPQYEVRRLKKDGATIWCEMMVTVIDYEGKPGIMGNIINITERKQAEEKLHVYHERLRSLASESSLAEEGERRRIATEVDDRINQNLAFAKLLMGSLLESVNDPYCRAEVREVSRLVDETIKDTRSLISELSSPVLYELGFVPAMQWLAQQTSKRLDIPIDFEDDGHPKPLSDDVRVILFQAVRELLANVIRHSGAQKAKVTIVRNEDQIQINVRDDGIGFDPTAVGPSMGTRGRFGLFSIRERLEPLGGQMNVASRPGQGTQVVLVGPLKSEV